MPLHYELQSGDICEVLTSKKERGPSRDWLALAKTTRAQSKIRAWFTRERREDSERTGREILHENLKRAGLPPQKLAGSPLLADVIREMGFKKGEDFYIALGQSKISPKTVTSKLMHRLKEGEGVEPASAAAELLERREAPKKTRRLVDLRHQGAGRRRRDAAAGQVLPAGAGRPDRRLHLARQGHHDPPRELPQRPGADAQPGALHQGRLGGRHLGARSASSCRSTAGTAHRLLEDLSRTFAETGINILEARCTVVHPMVKNRFVVEVGDTQALKTCITRLRNIESVFDAYRVTPTG